MDCILVISYVVYMCIILQGYSQEFLGNGHLEGRKPYGIRLQPIQGRGNDMNRRWKVPSLLKKYNKTAPIMEENEEALSSESEQASASENSWVSPVDSAETFKNSVGSVPPSKSPLNMFISPMNGEALQCMCALSTNISFVHTT